MLTDSPKLWRLGAGAASAALGRSLGGRRPLWAPASLTCGETAAGRSFRSPPSVVKANILSRFLSGSGSSVDKRVSFPWKNKCAVEVLLVSERWYLTALPLRRPTLEEAGCHSVRTFTQHEGGVHTANNRALLPTTILTPALGIQRLCCEETSLYKYPHGPQLTARVEVLDSSQRQLAMHSWNSWSGSTYTLLTTEGQHVHGKVVPC
ncbi:uncharacterized protein [Manis javanica]|uniref:uncharacterized protein isoform X2 n=1 Tax=Manis javanica TaxID=9974 RepID=UPI003C6DAE0E